MRPRHLLALLAICVMPAIAVATPPGNVTLNTTAGPIAADGSTTVFSAASTPVIEQGVFSQQITQAFDPARMRITNPASIIAPAGWTLSYSTDGTVFSATTPANQAAWDQVRAVRANGPIDSNGSTGEGYQVAQREATFTQPPASSFSGSAGGDGWDVAFDDHGRVFNSFHHYTTGQIDCHNRADGSLCAGFATPFTLSTVIDGLTHNFMSPHQSRVWVDPQTDHLWFATAVQNRAKVGFGCIDVSYTPSYPTGAPRWCATPFVNLKAHNAVSNFDVQDGLAQVGRELYMRINTTDELLCLDLDANAGAGGPCAAQPYDVGAMDQPIALSGKIYFASGAGMGCFDPATKDWCAAWPIDPNTNRPSVDLVTSNLDNHQSYEYPYELPDANGAVIGICLMYASGNGRQCVNPAGVTTGDGGPGAKMTGTFPYPNSLATADIAWHNKEPVRSGTRVYWLEGQYNTSEELRCWDAAVNAGAGGICAGAGWPGLTENRGYALTIDPENPLCVWSNGDPGQIKVWDYDGTPGCSAPLPDVTFDAEVVVPRMACDGPGRVRRWVEFRLTAPVASDYTSATLNIATADGTPIAGWQSLPIVVDDNGDRVVDLSGLDVGDSGIDPQFTIRFVGRTVANDVTARIVAVGDAPQLCLDLDPYPTACPAGPGPQPDPLPAPPVTTVGATGRATLASDSTETEFTPADATLAQDARADADCLGVIAGEATEDGSGAPIAGAVVELIDGSGAMLDQAVTDANGAYQFTRLAAGGDYRVRFGASSLLAPDAPTDGSATTPRTVTAGATLDVDGVYAILPTAPDRTATGVQGTTLRLDPFQADGDSPAVTGGTGATPIPGDTLLCGADETAPACTKPELITDQGVWRVDGTTGQVTFAPAPDFVGTAGPIAYRVITTLGTTAHATLRATLTARPADPAPPVVTPAPVVVPPSALPDATSTPRGVAVTLDVLANDGAGLLGSTLQVRHPRTGAWVTSFVAPGQGTWQVIDGTLRFAPLRDFTGPATPIAYRASTAGGAVATSSATVRVLPGDIPWANPDFRQGMSGETLVFVPLANDARPDAIIASSVRLQDPRTGAWVLSVTIRGEGTWSVDPATGRISFAHAPGFVGRTTPVRYRASGRFGTVSRSALALRSSGMQSIDSTVTALIRTTGPALQITTTAARTTLRPGARTTVTLTVINPGTAAATSTRVCATLPRGLRLMGRPAGALVSGRAVCMSAGDMAAGATVTYRLDVVATRAAVRVAVSGSARATNVDMVRDGVQLRVLAPPVRVTG